LRVMDTHAAFSQLTIRPLANDVSSAQFSKP
jgi:hypothetical protein